VSAPKKNSSGGGARRRGGHDEEHAEHENEERWLLTYADMITLLMVLFIVMFAMSQVDQRKFMQLKNGLASGFGAPVAMLSGGSGMLDVGGAIAPDTVNLAGQAGGRGASSAKDTINPAAVAQLATATEKAQVEAEAKKLQQAQQALQKAIQKAGLRNGATLRFDERGLVVTIATDKVLFENGSAVLRLDGERILNAVAPVLRGLPNKLSVDGHTNSIPISTAQYADNWDLSVARATGVLRYLAVAHDLPMSRMSATGFADTRPLLADESAKAMVVNRRVEIVVLAAVDDAAGRAIAALGNGSTAAPGATRTVTASPSTSSIPTSSPSPSSIPTSSSTPAGASGSDGHGTG
jgi:chemotaxis protein MotB